MRFYTQLFLWTYILLPAISLLLTPTFIIAVAKAQQQRAKIKANALVARTKSAAAWARNHQRRYIPTNKFSNGFGQNILRFRSKRDLDTGFLGIANANPPINEKQIEMDDFERKSHWGQQEESLEQLENMWNMNNFAKGQNNDEAMRRTGIEDGPELMEEIVGGPYLYTNRNHESNINPNYHSGAFSSRNVFDEFWRQDAPVSSVQNTLSPFIEDRAANPEPTHKKKKKRFGLNHSPQSYPQNYNSYYSQHPYHDSYYRNVEAELPQHIPEEADDSARVTNGDMPFTEDIRSANPEPTFKLKKKLKQDHQPYPYSQNYYNIYQTQYTPASANYYPYYRGTEFEDIPQNKALERDNIREEITSEPFPHVMAPIVGEPSLLINMGEHQMDDAMLGELVTPRFAYPEPTFKKKNKKTEQMPPSFYYPQYQYNSYLAPDAYSNNNNYNPYYRSGETVKTPENAAVNAGEVEGQRVGFTLAEPVLNNIDLKLAGKAQKRIEPPTKNLEKPVTPIVKEPVNPAAFMNLDEIPYKTESLPHNEAITGAEVENGILGEEMPFETAQKSARAEHVKTVKKQDNEGFFFSSNFYEINKADQPTESDDLEANRPRQTSNINSKNPPSEDNQADVDQKAFNSPRTSELINSIQNPGNAQETLNNQGVHDDSEDVVMIPSFEEKSADSNADPHHHNKGHSHTHNHFISHTHGHSNQKTLGNQPVYGIPHATPHFQIPPSHLPSQGFVNHGGVHNTFAQTHSNSFGNSFGSSGGQNAAIAQSQAQVFNGGFGQSTAQASAHAGLSGHNFGHGFHNTQGFSASNAHIVGQQHQEESFVMPHLDEIPVRELISEMESHAHRSSRTPQDFQDPLKGLELASRIVDASLNRNSFLEKNRMNMFQSEPEAAQKTTGFVTNIVDSSLRAGEDTVQGDSGLPTSANPESARHLTLQGISSITDIVNQSLRSKRQYSKPLGDYASRAELTQSGKNTNVVEPYSTLETTTETNKDMVLTIKSPDEVLQMNDKTEENIEQKLNANNSYYPHEGIVRAPVGGDKENDVLRMIDPELLIPTPEVITNEPWASNWDYVNKKVIYDIPESKKEPTQNVSNDSELNKNKTNESSTEGNFTDAAMTSENETETMPEIYKETSNISNYLELKKMSKGLAEDNFKKEGPGASANENVTETVPVFHPSNMSNDLKLNKTGKSISEESFHEINPTITSGNITEYIPIFHKETLNTGPKDATENPNIDITIPDKKDYSSDLATTKIGEKITEFSTESSGTLHRHVINDSVMDIPWKENGVNVKHKDSSNQQNNDNHSDSKIEDVDHLAIPKETLSHLFDANGSRKNISDLTSEEIQDLQFDLPSDPKGANNIIKPDNEKENNNTSESGTKGDVILELSPKNIKEMEGISSDPENDSLDMQEKITRIILNRPKDLFASFEEEMTVLTDEEKQDFLKQELDLLLDVIEETRKHELNSEDSNLNKNTTEHAKNDTKEATPKESVTSPHIFQVFSREDDREEYSRHARSAQPNEEVFDDLLGEHREKVDKIKNLAADEDEDLLLISFIGDSVIRDLENRRLNQSNQSNENISKNHSNPVTLTNSMDNMNLLNRHTAGMNLNGEENAADKISSKKTKREITNGRASRAPLTQLISDPMTKLDVERTLQNLQSIARHTFENPRAPMYHVRNMLGNAKNSVMSAAKLPPNNFLIPSKYEITKISQDKQLNDEKVGAINQQMLVSRSGIRNAGTANNLQEFENAPRGTKKSLKEFKDESLGNTFELEDTFQKIGGLVKDSVQSGRDAVIHVNDAAADAKKVLYTRKYATPRLILPTPKPLITSRGSYNMPSPGAATLGSSPPNRKAVLITPRIFEVQENIVGAPHERPGNFIGMGHILDAAGLTQPNQPEFELQKIEFEPSPYLNRKPLTTLKKKLPNTTGNARKNDSLEDTNGKDQQSTILGAQQFKDVGSSDLLLTTEHAVVTESLKDFVQRMHNEMREIVKSQYEERKRQRMQRVKPTKKPYYQNIQDSKNLKETSNILGDTNPFLKARNNFDQIVKMSLAPESLNRFLLLPQNQNLMRKSEDSVKKYLPIPTIDSRIQDKPENEKVSLSYQDVVWPTVNYAAGYPYQIQNAPSNSKNLENYYTADEEEQVELNLAKDLMNPFMNQRPNGRREQIFEGGISDDVSSKDSDNSNEEQTVAALLPPELMKPFMGQASETLLHDYWQENGDNESFEQGSFDDFEKISKTPVTIKPNNSNILFPSAPPLPSLNQASYVLPNLDDLIKNSVLPQLSVTPGNLEVSKQNFLLSSGPNIVNPKLETVGAPRPRITVDKGILTHSSDISEKTKEIVELLSVPKINDSELSEYSQEDLVNSLDSSAQNKLGVTNNLASNKPKKESPTQNNFVISSREKPNKKHPSIIRNDKEDSQEDLKQRPSYTTTKNLLTVGHVPDNNDLGYVLGAINPMMFERYFKERLNISDSSSKDTHDKFLNHGIVKNNNDDGALLGAVKGEQDLPTESQISTDDNQPQPSVKKQENLVTAESQKLHQIRTQTESGTQQDQQDVETTENLEQTNQKENQNEDGSNELLPKGRTSMKVMDPFKKPFMGHITKNKMNTFLNQYNNNLPESNEKVQEDKQYTQYKNYGEDNIERVKDVMFSSLNDDDGYSYGF